MHESVHVYMHVCMSTYMNCYVCVDEWMQADIFAYMDGWI